MRLAILDATAVGGGPVTRALECAAREVPTADAAPAYVRVYRLFTTCCAACGGCASTGRCSARSAEIDEVARVLRDADLLLVGVLSGASQRDTRAEALLRRLVGSFGQVYDSRYGECRAADAGCSKSAGLICSSPPLMSAAAALGALPYGLSAVWRVLDRAGVEVVGTATVARRWSGPASWDQTRDRSVRLGRALAASAHRRPVAVPAVEEPLAAPRPVRVRVA